MADLMKLHDAEKKERTTLFEGVYTCPVCGCKKINVKTSYSSSRIVKDFHCEGCGHRWNNLEQDSAKEDQLS